MGRLPDHGLANRCIAALPTPPRKAHTEAACLADLHADVLSFWVSSPENPLHIGRTRRIADVPWQAGLDGLCLAGLCVGSLLENLAHQQGFEPRSAVLETAILPLDDWY